MFSSKKTAVALDCEMVGTKGEDEAVRVCVIDDSLNTLLNTYIQPQNHVTNYWTHITGIWKIDLVGAPCIKDVRSQVEMLTKHRLLVGHSLEYDL